VEEAIPLAANKGRGREGLPSRALVVSNKSGIYELYAFDLISKSMRQVTNRPSGTVFGTISPDGRHIYYLDDRQGNETGHFIRVPFEGEQTVQDLTPSLPPYSTLSCFIDDTSSHFGVTVPTKEGFDSYVIDLSGDSISKQRRISRSSKLTDGPTSPNYPSKNDTCDPPRQVELYEAKAQANGKDVRVEWFETGHAATNTLLSIAHQELMLKWAYDVLKARTKELEP
jgi:hypothetical protein